MVEGKKKLPVGISPHLGEDSSLPAVRIAVVTVSDSRTPETDVNGQYLSRQIKAIGCELVAYHIIRDEPAEILLLLERLQMTDAQVILFNGGTGISKRDTTYEALTAKLEMVLPGFGELFRMLSYEQVGAPAMFSRAIAGVANGMLIFSTPGSPAAVELAWEKLISPDLRHLVSDINK